MWKKWILQRNIFPRPDTDPGRIYYEKSKTSCGNAGGACCLSIGFGGTETKSKCGELEYSIFRRITKDGMILEAFSKINGIPFLLRIDTKNAQNDKLVFERILESFARTKADTLTLSGIKPN